MLSATLLLLNLSIVHGVAHTFMDELFSLLKNELLPKNNKMPTTRYEARKLIRSLRLTYESTHACTNGCVLFRQSLKHTIICPNYNSSRYMEGFESIPRKVFEHFLLIP
jgi:hypothetical protein